MQQELEINQKAKGDATGAAARSVQLILTAAVFLAVFILGCFLANRVALPFSNPEGILGTLSVIQYNPLNNIVRFLLITLSPTIALAALFFIVPRKLASWLFPPSSQVSDEPRAAPWRSLAFPMLIVTTLLLGLNARSYYSAGVFEPFEEGQPGVPGFRISAAVSPIAISFSFTGFMMSLCALHSLSSSSDLP